jgi:hypothetical protein
MKYLANYLKIAIIFSGIAITHNTNGQSILGKWQLIKETTCMDDELGESTESDSTETALLDEMKSMSGPTAQIVTFREKGSGEESTRILSRKKYANGKNFLYKFNGEMLIILDKKSQTLTEMFKVDKITTDSLILSNEARACETRIFLKIKDPKPN